VNAALGPFAIAAGLLLVAGVLKAGRPHDTAVAVRKLGLPLPDWAVRVGAAAEAALGVLALVLASRVVASFVAASYLVFLTFVVIALVRALPIASCGCFGRADSPPSLVHVGVNVAAVLAVIVVAVDPGRSPLELVGGAPLEGAAYALLVVVGVAASGLALTTLPHVLALTRTGDAR